jgi:hypothetical protein
VKISEVDGIPVDTMHSLQKKVLQIPFLNAAGLPIAFGFFIL